MNSLVRPGDRLLISIKFLNAEDFGHEESCHPEIVMEDFLQNPNDPLWEPEFHSILPNKVEQ